MTRISALCIRVLGPLLLFAATVWGADAPVVAVLKGYDTAETAQVLEGFRESFGEARYLPVPLAGDGRIDAAGLADARPQLVLALGTPALEALRSSGSTLPTVATMVLDEEALGAGRGVTGVFLGFSPETELRWLKKMLPGARTVGVLYDPAQNREQVARAQRAAQANGLTLLAREVDSPKALPAALDALSTRVDVLWGISDRTVLAPQTAKNILLFSFRNRIPFVGLSEAWVKAGAFYALDRDYRDIGRQCGELAARLLREQGASPPPQPPRTVVYSLNRKTAEQMKIDVPADLLKGSRHVY